MNREGYIDYLERFNGYCGCPQVQGLLREKRSIEQLIAKCSLFKRNVDLDNPAERDIKFLTEYRSSVIELNSAVERYKGHLKEEIIRQHLKLRLHDDKNCRPLRFVGINEANIIQDLHENSIFTAHCSECEQQINVI